MHAAKPLPSFSESRRGTVQPDPSSGPSSSASSRTPSGSTRRVYSHSWIFSMRGIGAPWPATRKRSAGSTGSSRSTLGRARSSRSSFGKNDGPACLSSFSGSRRATFSPTEPKKLTPVQIDDTWFRVGKPLVKLTRPTSGRRAVSAPDGLGGGTNHHPHQWLRRREIRASASVGGDRGPQVGPALAAEITTVTNVSPEFLGRVTPSAGFAERDRMMPAFREEQRPQSNEQQHGMHRRPQARTCQDPSAKKVLWKAVDWGRQHLIRTLCPPILVDSVRVRGSTVSWH